MSLFNKFKIGLGKSSSSLTDGFKNIFSKKKIDENAAAFILQGALDFLNN